MTKLSPSVPVLALLTGHHSYSIHQKYVPSFCPGGDLKRRYWGWHFWARGYFGVTSGELTEEMIKECLEHHFEPKVDDNFRTED